MGFGDEKSHACRRCSAVSLPCHRHEEFPKFLPIIDREAPKRLAVHLILDNYGTHKHPDVQRWRALHTRLDRARSAPGSRQSMKILLMAILGAAAFV